MSTARGCNFFESALGRWFYLLDDSGRANAWDWREGADCYGPFSSERAAIDHLHENHSNPGSYNVIPHAEFRLDKVYEEKIKAARRASLW